jgi:phosphopantetheinyl transferase
MAADPPHAPNRPQVSLHLLELPGWGMSPGERRPLSRQLVRTVLAPLLGCAVAAVPLREAAGGRPVLAGEDPALGAFSVSHDERVLAVACFPAGCGLDVEDSPPELLLEVAHRFAATAERSSGLGAARARALWAAKEAVAKALGVGLPARLATITFDADPGQGWARARWRGASTGLLARATGYPGRHLAIAARTATPPLVATSTWRARPADGGWELRPAGGPRRTGRPWLPPALRTARRGPAAVTT